MQDLEVNFDYDLRLVSDSIGCMCMVDLSSKVDLCSGTCPSSCNQPISLDTCGVPSFGAVDNCGYPSWATWHDSVLNQSKVDLVSGFFAVSLVASNEHSVPLITFSVFSSKDCVALVCDRTPWVVDGAPERFLKDLL